MEAIILEDIINNTYVVLYLIHGPLDHLLDGLTHGLWLDRLIYHMHEFHLDTETSDGGSLILSVA